MTTDKKTNHNLLVIVLCVFIFIAFKTCSRKAYSTELTVNGMTVSPTVNLSEFIHINSSGNKTFPAVSLSSVKDSTAIENVKQKNIWRLIGTYPLVEYFDYVNYLPKKNINDFKYLYIYPSYQLNVGSQLWFERRTYSISQRTLIVFDKCGRFALKVERDKVKIYGRRDSAQKVKHKTQIAPPKKTSNPHIGWYLRPESN